uniref:PS II complex 12 kDa extrinsic protein n=2 Tax=Ditylum brightwellii TaxID=49249 RepID=A0A6V2N5W1_9STRA|mmetsp:Transcript_1610/g.2188  ORF Transcript_1610/g.2188 Transcript_1610/m.2188 type:complete len:140 (+) Transcript_1610:431-850(+)
MKLSVVAILSVLGVASAFAPANLSVKSTALNAEAEQSRKAFLGAAASALFIPAVANAGTMAQENVFEPTERWESGKPTSDAEKLRVGRYTNARNQMNSNFAPQKRLTLERKSPVERLDINAPNFEAYKRTFPGLYKKIE